MLLREELALPCAVTGPLDFAPLARAARGWSSDFILGSPFALRVRGRLGDCRALWRGVVGRREIQLPARRRIHGFSKRRRDAHPGIWGTVRCLALCNRLFRMVQGVALMDCCLYLIDTATYHSVANITIGPVPKDVIVSRTGRTVLVIGTIPRVAHDSAPRRADE